MAITIDDVAREAGVCIGTVSRVINGKDRVHPKTREKIQRVIKQLDYRPSLFGRGLVTRRTHNIMLLVHDLADPFCVAIAKRLSGLCRNQGFKLVMGDSDHSPEIEAECLEMVRDGSVDGLIVAPVGGRHNQPLFSSLAASGFPVVSVNDSLSDCRIPCVNARSQLNCCVPEEIVLMAFGNTFPDGSMSKPMTTVSLPVDQLADRAWRLLQSLIQKAGKPPAMTAVDFVSPTLSVRQTA